ncbi:hypothetical protein FOMA001_g7514 [Fusarium oxysporum f. sp. matthiolae]|nr:hypothetical protein FOMA001_g7514 [Fusarium oxysporum f. sp. matthiolae]
MSTSTGQRQPAPASASQPAVASSRPASPGSSQPPVGSTQQESNDTPQAVPVTSQQSPSGSSSRSTAHRHPASELCYGKRLFKYAERTSQQDRFYILTFGVLHRLNITHLHNELGKIKARIYGDEEASEETLKSLQEKLKDYGMGSGTLLIQTDLCEAADNEAIATAIRDYNDIIGFEGLGEKEEDLQRRLLGLHFPNIAGLAANPYYTGYRGIPKASTDDPLRSFLWRQTWLARLFRKRQNSASNSGTEADESMQHHSMDSNLFPELRPDVVSELLTEVPRFLSLQDSVLRYASRAGHSLQSELDIIIKMSSYASAPDAVVRNLRNLADDFDRMSHRTGLSHTTAYKSMALRARAMILDLEAAKLSGVEFINVNALPRPYLKVVDNLVRLAIALTGGISLIVPMLIMSIDGSAVKSLIITSASVFLFVFFFAFGVRASDKATFAAAAAYAAVLVVFVGTSLPSVK